MSMIKDAIIDRTGQYRYWLKREWDHTLPPAVFIMLNPSTADHTIDDPTIRRCIGFARLWGHGSLEVVNLFALRATNPLELQKAADPVGPDNDYYIEDVVYNARNRFGRVVLAWGAHGSFLGRDKEVLKLLKSTRVIPYHLAKTRQGQPSHPLYLPANSQMTVYGPAACL